MSAKQDDETASNKSDPNHNDNNNNNCDDRVHGSASPEETAAALSKRVLSRHGADVESAELPWTTSSQGHYAGYVDDEEEDDDDDEHHPGARMTPLDNVGLLCYKREPLRPKDFVSEVRAPLDVEQFAHQAELLLDLDTVPMRELIDSMLVKTLAGEQLNVSALDEVRASIFVRGSSMLLAHTIQGVFEDGERVSDEAGAARAGLKHDQSWLCALCNLAQIARRHMVIARFKRPMNMGENARHVRLFVLVLVPTNEKSTKDQLETGRTFATMLTESAFRRRLMAAASEIEFKSLMVVRAQQLARSKRWKNRHKYLLDAALHERISSGQLSPDDEAARPQRNNMLAAGPRSVVDVSPLVFNKNPRTSKLFELIALDGGADDDGVAKEAQCRLRQLNVSSRSSAAQKKQKKLAELEAAARDESAARKHGDAAAVSLAARLADLFRGLEFGRSAWDDFTRRLGHYPSDFRDGFVGPPRTPQKTVATIWFLYFGILLPTIAFSSLNSTQTHRHMGDLRKALIGQAIGGLGFALFGGQPLVIIMTTAPLCLYTKVIHQMCLDYGFPFPAMYAAVGLWNGLFLVLYSMFGFSRLMKWCTRSTEEIFALFIVVAFITDASKDTLQNFHRFYLTPACEALNKQTSNMLLKTNHTIAEHSLVSNSTQSDSGYRDIEQEIEASVCRRETSLLFVLLMLGTLWLSVTLYKFRRTQYLSPAKRDLLADYALPTAVILMSLLGSTVFNDIYVEKFPPLADVHFERAPVESLPLSGILTSLALGFTLSLLFFMDQNISAAMVNTPQNRLKKGDAFHYDLFIIGLLNGCLTLYGLPMMHGVLPHSPLHARSLADIEEQVEEGHLREVVVSARETRVTGIVAHILLLGSLLLIPYPIAYIPRAVLNGLFLYMAITSLDGLQVFERIMLLFTEQNKYPPNHYIRRCPQRKIHQFTFLQLVQLLVMCLFGFSPINAIEMFFPVIILLMIPFRHKIVPRYINEQYLDALDGKH